MTEPTTEHAAEQRPHDEGGSHGGHPSDKQYVLIAAILAVVTAIEVIVSYMKGLHLAGNPILLVLAVIKFSMVVMFFMHLRFDNRMLRTIFVSGLILAAFVYISVLFTLHVLSLRFAVVLLVLVAATALGVVARGVLANSSEP